MFRGLVGAVSALCFLLISACTWLDPAPELEASAGDVYKQFRAGDLDSLKLSASPVLAPDLTPENVANIQTYIPKTAPDSIRLIGYSQNHQIPEGSSTPNLTYEYYWPDQVALVNVAFSQKAKGAAFGVDGFNIQLATREELKANDFHLFGKSPVHYLVLAGVIASVALMITAIVMSIRTPGLRRRWLWILGSLTALSQFGLNWATGLVKFVLLHGALIGVVVEREDSLFAPWVLKTPIPIGAIIVISRLWRRRKALQDKAAQDIPPT
jgi:hypothetical protein